MKRFFCDKCGKCCEKLPALVIDPGLDDGTGKCNFMTHKPIYALFMTSGQIYATLIRCIAHLQV